MAYGRRRSTYRRKGRRGNRTLSTRNIFNNKGARAQARQISSLKRRINYVYKQCRPEIKFVESNPTIFTLKRDTTDPFFLYQVSMPELGVEDNARIGNSCNILDSHLFLNFQMLWEGDVQFQLNGLGQTVSSTIRVVPFMVKSPSNYQPDPNDILSIVSYSAGNAQYRLNPIGPFNEGVSSKYQILGDYRYSMSLDDRSHINSKIKIKGSKIQKYIDTQYNNIGKAALYVLITWNGLDPISYQGETIATPVTYITLADKVAYTDP